MFVRIQLVRRLQNKKNPRREGCDISITLLINACLKNMFWKQPFRGALRKRYSENMQQIYRRAPMPKCDFNKTAKQIY